MSACAKKSGYILLECLVALMVLSIGAAVINRSLYQVMLTRALTRDYTQARFLLEQLISEPQLKYWSTESEERGEYQGHLSRFSWYRKVERLPVSLPTFTGDVPAYILEQLERRSAALGKVTVTVTWTRAGQTYERTVTTIIPPGRFWVPETSPEQLRFEEGEKGPESSP